MLTRWGLWGYRVVTGGGGGGGEQQRLGRGRGGEEHQQ